MSRSVEIVEAVRAMAIAGKVADIGLSQLLFVCDLADHKRVTPPDDSFTQEQLAQMYEAIIELNPILGRDVRQTLSRKAASMRASHRKGEQKAEGIGEAVSEHSGSEIRRPIPSVIPRLVDRFLSWPLPKDFSPDCGISFDGRKPDQWNLDKGWPIGTNLLTADQARQMLEYLLDGSESKAQDELLAIHEAVMNPQDVKHKKTDTFTVTMVKDFILR